MLIRKYIFAILTLVLLSSNAFPSIKERIQKKQLSVGVIGLQSKIDPILGYNYIDYMLIQCVFQTLVRVSSDGDIVGNIVESWKISKDRKKYTFKISDNAYFSNGLKIKSADIIYSLSLHIRPDSKSIIKNYLFDLIKFYDFNNPTNESGLVELSSDTFEINLKQPYAPFLYILTMPGFSIIHKSEEKVLSPIGSGPMIADLKPDTINFITNTKYYGNKTSIRSISLKTFKSHEEAINSLKNGETDVILNLPFTKKNVSNIPKGFNFRPTESLTYQHLFLNNKVKIPLELRKLLGELINDVAMKSTKEIDFFKPITTFLPIGILSYKYYNRAISKPKLASITKYLSTYEKRIRFVFPKERTSESFISELRLVFKELSDYLVIEELELPEIRKRLSTADYEYILFAYIGNFPDPDGFLDSIRQNNIPGVDVNSDELFKKIEKYKFDTNLESRIHGYESELRNFEDKWTIIPLFQVKLPFVASDKIKLPYTKYRYEAELWNFLWED